MRQDSLSPSTDGMHSSGRMSTKTLTLRRKLCRSGMDTWNLQCPSSTSSCHGPVQMVTASSRLLRILRQGMRAKRARSSGLAIFAQSSCRCFRAVKLSMPSGQARKMGSGKSWWAIPHNRLGARMPGDAQVQSRTASHAGGLLLH